PAQVLPAHRPGRAGEAAAGAGGGSARRVEAERRGLEGPGAVGRVHPGVRGRAVEVRVEGCAVDRRAGEREVVSKSHDRRVPGGCDAAVPEPVAPDARRGGQAGAQGLAGVARYPETMTFRTPLASRIAGRRLR